MRLRPLSPARGSSCERGVCAGRLAEKPDMEPGDESPTSFYAGYLCSSSCFLVQLLRGCIWHRISGSQTTRSSGQQLGREEHEQATAATAAATHAGVHVCAPSVRPCEYSVFWHGELLRALSSKLV